MQKRLSRGSSSGMDVDDIIVPPPKQEVEEMDDAFDPKSQALGQNSRRAYLRELKKVIESADVVLLVLDARDPAGTRSSAIEEMVLSNHRKKLVYVLNKADLVPRTVLAGWLLYLRQFGPCVPFKCNLQTQKTNLGRASGKASKINESALQTQQAVGAEELLGLLKNYCRSSIDSIKSSISVGIVGFPNVGKSSLVNSLTRQRAVQVSSTPGFTKQLQEVVLDKNIRLIDSPGIVFADGDAVATSLRNCVSIDDLEDVITPVEAILKKCPRPYLMQLYSIAKFDDKEPLSFLNLVARSTGKLKKGGIPNTDAAARSVLQDWNTGKIKYYTLPPAVSKKSAAIEAESVIVSTFSKQLDIDNLQESDIRVLDELEALDDASFVEVNEIANNLVEYSEPVEESLTARKLGNKKQKDSKHQTTSNVNSEVVSENLRKLQKKSKKKTEKDNRRQEKDVNADTGGDGLKEDNADYDFETDFQYN